MNKNQVKDVIRKWRDSPNDLKQEDFQQFKNLGSTCLAQGDSRQLLKCVQDEKNEAVMMSMGCVLLHPLVNELVKKEKSHDHCQAAITHLIKTCRPDEVLHSLLKIIEDIDPGLISETIIALIPHLLTGLARLPERRAASLGSVLCALQNQLSRLPVPYTEQQEAADVYGLCRCCTALATFIKPFVEEVKNNDGSGGTPAEQEEMRTELLQFCLGSLREPLLEAHLTQERESSLWLFAKDIMVTIPAIQESLSEILFFSSPKKMNSSESKESRACVAYLLFVQQVAIESFPAVFSPVFILQCNMEYINQLLSSKKESYLLKGLALYTKSLESVQDDSLTVSLLELKSFYSVPQKLRQVLTDCPMKHLRKSGLQVLQLFINKLDTEAKHKFFRCMLKTSQHSGVEGYIVKNIRNQVELSIKLGNTSGWFQGVEFLSLLVLVLSLPQGAETDLLHSMDRIMESLSLLRYLLIRDEDMRSSPGVWEELCQIKDEYLKTLRVCISLSRAYYSAELKALREDQKLKAKEARLRSLKPITVKHEKVSNMSPEVQHQVLQSALVTFDLMESLIVRVEEIAEGKIQN
ncbi:glomulin, FKBP associated protein b [Aulostomus maculatus]